MQIIETNTGSVVLLRVNQQNNGKYETDGGRVLGMESNFVHDHDAISNILIGDVSSQPNLISQVVHGFSRSGN